MKPNYYAQAESLLESHKAGRVSWTQVVEVMKSIPWGQTAPTGDYFASADVPVMNGPSLTAMLGVALQKGLVDDGQADRLIHALA